MFICPYCHKNKSVKDIPFENWNAVRKHTSKCYATTKEYYIDLFYGPLSYKEFIALDEFEIKNKFPNLSSSISSIKLSFKNKGIDIGSKKRIWTKEDILLKIKEFVAEFNKIPEYRDWDGGNIKYPSTSTIKKYFGTWNAAISAAGFEPNQQNGFGINTIGIDGHKYRSSFEAKFVELFLFGKYNYVIEPKYPEPYTKWYDWYIPELDLYIELDGGLRPQVIQEKIEINKKLNRKLLIVKTSEINNLQSTGI